MVFFFVFFRKKFPDVILVYQGFFCLYFPHWSEYQFHYSSRFHLDESHLFDLSHLLSGWTRCNYTFADFLELVYNKFRLIASVFTPFFANRFLRQLYFWLVLAFYNFVIPVWCYFFWFQLLHDDITSSQFTRKNNIFCKLLVHFQ